MRDLTQKELDAVSGGMAFTINWGIAPINISSGTFPLTLHVGLPAIGVGAALPSTITTTAIGTAAGVKDWQDS